MTETVDSSGQAKANRNGAEAVIQTLVDCGVDICFANPGTSEMHLVTAIDQTPGMRTVLGLFEGVVTGAADGYARMSGRPAATLLHLGPGFANGIANLHNARRAGSRIINLIGDHSAAHRKYDAPLTSDIEGLAGPVSKWVRTTASVESAGPDCAEAFSVAAGPGGGIATLILPADIAWSTGASVGPATTGEAPAAPDPDAVEAVARMMQEDGPGSILFLSGDALLEPGMNIAARIQKATGCRLMSPTFNARIQRGAGRVFIPKLPYLAEMATAVLQGAKHLVLVGAAAPVTFFGYQGKESWLAPADCSVDTLCRADQDAVAALTMLAEALAAHDDASGAEDLIQPSKPPLATGDLTPEAVAAALANFMPEDAIVSDEAITSGLPLLPITMGAAPHDWLDQTGGSLGQGMPVAVGAALACPDRKVISLQGDGAAMYDLQALWTQARENLDILTIVYSNRSYAILNLEYMRTGAGAPGEKAKSLMSIGEPDLDFVSLARGMGVEAARASTAEEFNDILESAMARKGPFLIEASVNVLGFGLTNPV